MTICTKEAHNDDLFANVIRFESGLNEDQDGLNDAAANGCCVEMRPDAAGIAKSLE